MLRNPRLIKPVHRVHITANDFAKRAKWNKAVFLHRFTTGCHANFLTMLHANKALCWEDIAFSHSQRKSENSSESSGATIPATFVNNSWLLHNLPACQIVVVLLGTNWTAKCIVRYVLGENISVFMKYRGEKQVF